MANKDRRTEVHSIFIKNKYTQEIFNKQILIKDLLNEFFSNMYTDRNNNNSVNKFEIKGNDLTYFFEKDDVYFNNDLINVKFNYLISNKKINIIDRNTLQKTGEKDKNEGDEERQHITIKTFDNCNHAILIFERISTAITIASLKDQLDEYLHIKYGALNIDLSAFEIDIKPAPSEDFLIDLNKTKRISLLKLTVDRDQVVDDIDCRFSGQDDNIRPTAELIYKPVFRNEIKKRQVEKVFRSYKENPKKILRIVVEANGENGKIKLDTEGAKMAKYINTNLSIDGLVDTQDIFTKFNNFINTIPDNLLDIYIDEVAAECED